MLGLLQIRRTLNCGHLKKYVVRINMYSADGFLFVGWDSDLPCPALPCRKDNSSQDRCSNLQPTVCAMSHCFRFHYQQCNNYIIIDTHCQHHDNQVWPLRYRFHSTLGSSLLRSTLRSLSFARTFVLL